MLFRALATSCLLAVSLGITGCAGSTDESLSDGMAAETSSASLAHDYRGTVAGVPVMLRLQADANGTALRGSYFYVGQVTKGETIVLEGTASGGQFSADESVNGKKTGSFKGTIASGKINGTWTSSTGRQHGFALEPVTSVTIVKRAVKDTAKVSDPDSYIRECYVDVSYVDVFGLPDAALEADLDKAIATDAAPLDKNAKGYCDWGYSIDGSSTVKLYEQGLLVVEQGSESNGGAYPNHSLTWINASTKTGKLLTLVDIVKAEQMTAIRDKAKAVYKASWDPSGNGTDNGEDVDDFLLETVDRAFEEPSTVQFELTKEGLRISMFNALPHAAQAEDGDGALLAWSDIKDLIIPTSDAAVLAR